MLKKFLTISACALLALESTVSLVQAIADQKSMLVVCLYILLVLFSFISLIFTARSEFKGHIRLTNRKKINKKIVEFIETTGETIILSRDLSWVDSATLGRFKQKVEGGDKLTIFLPEATDISKEIAGFADVRYFGNLFEGSMDRLMSRFTIIHYGTDSIRITYPQENNSWHINTEYTQGDAVLTLATDVVKLLDIITKGEPNGPVPVAPTQNRSLYSKVLSKIGKFPPQSRSRH